MPDPPTCPICGKFRPCIHDRKEQVKNAYRGTVSFAKNAWHTVFGGPSAPSTSSDDDFSGFGCAGSIVMLVGFILGGTLLYLFNNPGMTMPGQKWVYIYSWIAIQILLSCSIGGFEKVLDELYISKMASHIAVIISGIILLVIGPAFIITIFVLNIVWEQGLGGSMWAYIGLHLGGCCAFPFLILLIIYWFD